MKKCVRVLAAMLAVLTMVSLSGCTSREEADGLRTIDVCEVTHSVFYAPQYVAMSQGLFAEEGLSVELTVGQGADKVMAAVLSGSVDIGLAGPEAAIYVMGEGREDYPQVFAQLTQRDGSFLVGREPDEDFQWEDLKGSHLLPGRKGGVPYMTLEYVVREHGLTPGEDVLFDDSVDFSLMASAFAAGTGDYVTIFEPTASAMEMQGQGYILHRWARPAAKCRLQPTLQPAARLRRTPDSLRALPGLCTGDRSGWRSTLPKRWRKCCSPTLPIPTWKCWFRWWRTTRPLMPGPTHR